MPLCLLSICLHAHFQGFIKSSSSSSSSQKERERGREMRMATAVLLIVALLVVMMGSTSLVRAWEDSKVIHVGGRVLCQDCTKGYDEWVNGGSPIKGAKVSLTCMDQRHRVIFYGSDDTDGAGQFNMVVNRHINGKRLDGKLCSVRLVSSPDPACDVATDFAGGRRGVKLSRPSSVYREVIKYAVGPLYYTSPMCDEPELE